MSQSAPTNSVPASRRRLGRSFKFALFFTGLLWYALSEALAGRAARGITNRFNAEDARPLLTAFFLIFLLIVGFSLLDRGSRKTVSLWIALGLPRRPTSGREWLLGAAIGWGVAVASVLPMALGRTLHVRLWTAPRAFNLLLLHIATLLFATLATEIALRGFPFRRLIDAIGPIWATGAMAVLLGLVHGISPDATWISILVTMVGGVVLSLAWLRTHGLWLGWGLHFAWSAAVGLVFGLPIRGVSSFAAVIQTRAVGRTWLTGDEFGPEGAFLTLLALLIAIIVLVRTTDDYAWDYTRPELVPAGYEVTPPPPAGHLEMEQSAAAKAPVLVQILPTTPQNRSVDGR